MQATVFRYDETTATGSVITDQGLVMPFGVEAMLASGLRHLRPGQRLTIHLADPPARRDASSPEPSAAPQIAALSLGSIVPD